MHRKCKYFGRKVEFDGVARVQSGDPHQFLANPNTRSKLIQYNIDIEESGRLQDILLSTQIAKEIN